MPGPWNNIKCMVCPRRGLRKNMVALQSPITGKAQAYICKTCSNNAETRGGDLVIETEPSKPIKKEDTNA